MARLKSQRLPADVTSPPNGTGAPASKPSARYCALCGRPAGPGESAIDRFGDAFCSEAHAEEFVQTVRAARVKAAVQAETAVEGPGGPTAGAVSQRDWKAVFGKALCWGAPLLAVAFVLAGGTGALVGWAGAALPFLAALACPLGMYFMMRGMSKMGDHGDSKDKPEGR
jgi:hypothetical protein